MSGKRTLLRVGGYGLLCLFCVGFRPFFKRGDFAWPVTRSEPTLWVKFCDDSDWDIDDLDDFPSGDPLAGGAADFDAVMQAIYDDVNDVGTAYVRLAAYPADPDSPGAPAPGDSTFTREAAEERTIDVCVGGTPGAAAGFATPDWEDDKTVGCEITLSEDLLESAQDFTATLTHELGHCLGLNHPQESVHAIMSYFSDSEVTRLLVDDKMGLTYLYPQSASQGEETTTFGLFGCTPKG